MKYFTSVIFISLFSVLSDFTNSLAQISVSGALVGNGSYLTLSSAFSAINSGAQTGASINILVTGNTSEPVNGAVLNAGTWTKITIQPDGGLTRVISGSINAGLPLLDLNGADNVTIDGLNTGGNSLTISNTTVSSTAGTSTLRLQSDAVNNIISRSTILGSSLATLTNNGGTVWIGANSVSSGNDNNTISFCDIGPAGTSLPSKAIFISGTSSTRVNNGDTIKNCNIYDYFNPSNSSSGIYIEGNSSDIIIKDNRFFQTAPRILIANSLHTAISVINTSGNNFQITGNTIGYSSSAAAGTYTISGASNDFKAIHLSVGTTAVTSVQGNTITEINHETASSGSGSSSPCMMIFIDNGLVDIGNIGGNIIGSMTSNGSISLSSSATGITQLIGIASFGNANVTINNNSIGGITASNSSTGAANVLAFSVNNTATTTFTCRDNFIGGTTPNSIQSTSLSNSSSVSGIFIDNSIALLSRNTIKNLTASAGTASGSSASVIGISINSTSSPGHNLSGNIIHTLSNTNSTAACLVTGIYFNGLSSSNMISGNFIHTLLVNNQTSTINGISANNGSASFQNNMIRLGIDAAGNSLNTGAAINGISETSGGNNFYFNSVYIGGNPTVGTSNTFALNSTVTSVTRTFRNNIFYNARSNNGSTGKHYAIRVGGTAFNPSGLTSNNNDILASGTEGVFGLFNGTDISELGSWQTIVGHDFSSFSSDPQFIFPNGNSSSVDLHINSSISTIIESNGIEIVSVTDDYDGQSRGNLTPADIGADAGNFMGIIPVNNISVSGALMNNGSFETLAAAFSAINNGIQTGANIEVTISGNTIEPPSGAVIYNGAWTSILVKPSGGSAKTISGSISAGFPLININGADNVIIDGLNEGGNSLTISNSTVSSVSGTCTILFQNDATYNSITNCSVFGSSIVSFAGDNNGGVISFGKSQSLITGNDFNTISNCNVGPAGSNLPNKCISFKGTTTTAVLNNSGDTIKNCNIYDFFNSSDQSGGIYVGTGNQGVSFINNKFYQTSPRTHTSVEYHSAIWIESNNGTSNNFDITGNRIGYSNSNGTGVYTINSISTSRIWGIYVSVDDIEMPTSIQGNTIAGISINGALTGTLNNQIPFVGIYISNGLTNVGNISGNIIGSATEQNSISYFTSSANTSDIIGIFNIGQSNWMCSNNVIGGFTINSSNNGGCFFRGIESNIPSNKLFTCQNNIIGGNELNSIQNFSNYLYYTKINGILAEGCESSISGNVIRNMTASGAGRNDPASVIGININSASANHILSNNNIYSLKNTQTLYPDNSNVTGIYFLGSSGSNLIEKNKISGLLVENQQAVVRGLEIAGGNTTSQNNMFQLGLDNIGNSLEIGATIYGIYESAGSNNFYFNSIYIGGNPNGGTSNTFAFSSSVLNNNRIFRNNIFNNSRSNNGSIGKHYAIEVGGSLPNPAGLTINNNVYFANGQGGVFGKYNYFDVTSLTDWQSAVGQDSSSFNEDPHFINPNGSVTSVDLHINSEFPSVINGNGVLIASVTDDFDDEIRSELTPVDIGADAVNLPSLYPNDIQISNALIENQIIILGNSYDIKALLMNIGTISQNSFPLFYTVNGSSPVGPVYTIGSIPQLGTEEIIFNDIYSFTPSSMGLNTLKIYSALSTDDYRGNDTVTLLIDVQRNISSLPFVETFSNLSNWSVLLENPLYDTKLWELGICTNPAGASDNIAATSNCYLGAEGRREILTSPVLDFSNFTSGSSTNFPVLDFYSAYTGYSGLDDSLEVLLSTDIGASFFEASTVYNKSQTSNPSLATRPVRITEYFPDSSKQWRHEQISLANVAGDSSVIIGFRSKSDFGNRQWIDNVIVCEATSFSTQTVSSPGDYIFGNISINMNTVGLSNSIPNVILPNRHSGINKIPPNRKKITGTFPGEVSTIGKNLNSQSDNSAGNELTVVKYPYHDPVPSNSVIQFAENDTINGATTGDGSRFTPNNIIPDVYFTASYSGNDYLGYANYDLKINVSGITSIDDINKIYILKRADRTGPWECVNTFVYGDTLISYGLSNFSDFSIGVFSNSKTLYLTLLIQGFYDATLNLMTEDTVRVFLRNSSSPYTIVDSAKAFTDPSGSAVFNFSSIVNGVPYYIQIKHRNSIETWSKTTQAFNSNNLSFDFTSVNSQAFGNNMVYADASPIAYAIYGGDMNQNGSIDLTDVLSIYNDANAFLNGYVNTDLTGNNITDLNDLLIAYNNSVNFVAMVIPPP